jgi:hypothetical protein
MSFKRTFVDWFVVLLILLFLPKDNRLMFDVKPEEWYGEVRITLKDRTYIVAQNASDGGVDLGVSPVTRFVVLQEGRSYGIDLPPNAHVLPRSIVIAEVPRGYVSSREYFVNASDYFQPGKLSILTQGDLYTSYLLVTLLLGAAMALGFVIARFGVEEEFELPDTT